ncbi:MAG: sulfatase [Planctomycetaceae bacterium]|nr:sulfatase [Planctomycetaceae bacterium]
MRSLHLCRVFVRSLFGVAVILGIVSQGLSAPPNIVLLFSDDAGFADFGFQDECSPEMAAVTPRLTKLASEGIRFTDAYVSGCVCSPSRAGLSTGRYQERFGHEMNIPPGYMEQGLPLSEKFIGDHLRPAGYKTGLIGKWHLGYPEPYQPNQRGYDHFYGFLQGARNYHPYPEDRRPPHQLFQVNGEFLSEEGYSTDRIGQAACEFIETQREHPFFLFVSFNAVHGPLQARERDYEALSKIEDSRHRHYVGMMKALDENVALILDCLEQNELADNTLVVFTNDNGGQTSLTASNAPLKGRKGSLWEGGVRVPMLMRWPGVIPAGRVTQEPVITLDFLPTFLAAAKMSPLPGVSLDGLNLLPLITGETDDLPKRNLYWRRSGPKGPISIRSKAWKIIFNRGEEAAAPELYHLRNDIGEENNLAAEHPEIVEELVKEMLAWESEMVDPLWGGPQRGQKNASSRAR